MSSKIMTMAALIIAAAGGVASADVQPAVGEPVRGLTPEQLAAFNSGFDSFFKSFEAVEGLGPVFNKESCGNCHSGPAVGGGSTQFVQRFGIMDDKGGGFDPLPQFGGSLLQASGITVQNGKEVINCGEAIPPQANVIAKRITPPVWGAGLVEAIESADIQFNADNPGHPDVSGTVRMVTPLEGGAERPGRFGWKLQVPTMLTFSGDAFLNEMGITNDLVGGENAPSGDLDLLAQCDQVADPEDVVDEFGKSHIEKMADFQRFLAAPPQTPKSGMSGEAIFNQIGCNVCHISTWTTPDDPSLEDALRNKTFKPYADFLLHDAGSAADFIADGPVAGLTEIRTAPLWGVALRESLWHDGSVAGSTFEERVIAAIEKHDVFGSEARFSARAFLGFPNGDPGLSPEDQQRVLDFLRSLGRREFDADINNIIQISDMNHFADCYTGPGAGTITPDDPCAIHDVDQDGDVDGDDLDLFLTVYTGPQDDCNENGVNDAEEIILGTGTDANNDGELDTCQCLADINEDGFVDSQDLNVILGAFGSSGEGDVNGDFQTTSADLNIILAAFGDPCP